MSQRHSSSSETKFHRKTAIACFNNTWAFLVKRDRTVDEDSQMLTEAHTSRYHWKLIGDAHNFAINDWQISRVYAALNQPHLALHFAKSALALMQEDELSDILQSGYEGMARAYAVAKDHESAKNYIKKAREQLKRLPGLDAERVKIYADQIRETEDLIGK